jgi:hypothetical protein
MGRLKMGRRGGSMEILCLRTKGARRKSPGSRRNHHAKRKEVRSGSSSRRYRMQESAEPVARKIRKRSCRRILSLA